MGKVLLINKFFPFSLLPHIGYGQIEDKLREL